MKLVFATHNQHKLREIQALLPPNIQLLSLDDISCNEDIPETATTIEDNALLKAQYVQKQYHCNVFADDTGLEVQALNNAPGVYSARYAGEHKSDVDNVQLLLKNMEGISRREAQFKTVIALCLEDVVYTFEGIAKGNISTTPIGTNGFGYDPIFIPENSDKTFAELTQDEKNRISHRGKAFGKLLDFLNQKIQ
ncbi:non-canonical purine NTP diphosphatase [Capnocytophaga sp. 051621]|uniref:dITP/XTP pyrophosphatase n=1 Tax=Capnocytophaga periodontitidis TaxID=2795027 RepID=A0ABS0SJT1_9FLAO|nr:non-canonical purine NTP diphosphatase [Capnocytophaga periodontitidis]MBI1645994.1 non-canonical purine NTP diphosphatase [Capnocytophaga periodontitidis]